MYINVGEIYNCGIFIYRGLNILRRVQIFGICAAVFKYICFFYVFLNMHHSIDFSKYQLSAQFFLSSTIYMLHYTPQQVSSSTLLIIRRTNCITTASGIVTLCKQPYSMQVESELQSALHLHTVWLFTEGDDTRRCGDTIGPPDDEQRAARNMLRSVV